MGTRNSHSIDFLDNGIQSSEYKVFCDSHDHSVTYTLCILEDCFNMNPLYGRTDYLRDKNTILRRYTHEGLSFLTKTLPGLFDSLLNYLETGNSAYPSFKLKHGAVYPVFLQRLLRPIYEDHTSEHTVLCMKCLYQLCAAFEKLKGPYKQGVLIKQLDEFVETDNSLSKEWSDDQMIVLRKARNLISKIIAGLNPFDVAQSELFLPRPGPGATNSPTRKHMRYRPHVDYPQLTEFFKYDEWYSSQSLNYRGYKGTLLSSSVDEASGSVRITQSLPTSRFKFVHKKFGKPRCICIEQLEVQWLQQGLRRALYSVVENHPLTKGYVSFTDQSINGLKALQASTAHGVHSTIDMSSASDRISRDLVEYLFGDNEELCKSLLSLSTRIIELPKDIPYKRKYLMAKKFAPMGSALCFPVMALVHFALIKSIISTKVPQHVNDIPVWVYGDDIILEKAHTDCVFEQLPGFGMKLNLKKSFKNSLFRESCGVHAYNGVIITPTRLKSIVSTPLSVNEVVSALRNESDLYYKGFRCTAQLIRSDFLKFKELRANNFPYVGRKSAILGWIRDDVDAQRLGRHQWPRTRRWNEHWQRLLYKCRVIVDLKDDDCPPICEDEYYLRKQVENPLETRKIDELSDGLSIHWKWLPDSAFYHA